MTTAHAGFRLAFVAEQVTTVWAPSGISVAALLLFGRSLWPAVWVGACLANLSADAPWWVPALIATGNTLEAVVATTALRRLGGFNPALSRVADVLAFVLVAALASTAISASVGAATLIAAGLKAAGDVGPVWFDWWLGDALGVLVVGSALLTFARAKPAWSARTAFGTVMAVALTAALTHFVFGRTFGLLGGQHPLEYVIFSIVIAVAVRYRQPATALAVLAVSAVTIAHTVDRAGPFAGATVHQSLVLLQVFMGVLAGTGLLLAAALTERRTSERRRAAAYSVGEVLTTAATLPEAAPAILRALAESLDWQIAALWVVEPSSHRVRCVATWPSGGAREAEFLAVTGESAFASGVGLPGRVWESGRPAWIEDVSRDPNFPRRATARAARARGAFAFPIVLEEKVIGVIECFTNVVAAPDVDLLRTMATVGHQIGQFVGRKQGDVELLEGQRRTSSILESALDAIIGMDHLGHIIEFNPAAQRTFGYTRDEAIGRELASLLIPAALRDRHREGLARYLVTGKGPFIGRRVETTGYHADGHEFPVEVSITRVPGEDPPRFTGFVRDVTDRLEAERERQALLQRESAARHDAEMANRAKDDFLATLSHELRTPLNAILGWTRMLLDQTLDEAGARRALTVIDRNAHLQVQLVSDILDVSRITAGGLTLDIRPLDLVTVIGAAIAPCGQRPRRRTSTSACGSPPRHISPRVIRSDCSRSPGTCWPTRSNSHRPAAALSWSSPARPTAEPCCGSRIPARASTPSSCRTCSSASARETALRVGRTGGWDWVWRSCSISCSCTGARS